MASNFKTYAAWVFLLGLGTACSQSKDGDKFQIGQTIDQTDPETFQLVEKGDAAQFYVYDTYSRRINFIDTATQTLQFSRDLGANSKGRFWLATQQDSYYFDVKDKVLSLTTQDGDSSQKILEMAGQIQSYAADFQQGYFAFVDEYFSIALLKMSPTGQVESQWRGSSVIGGTLNVVAGDIVDGGHLVLVTDKNVLVNIDIEATIAAEAWVHEEHTLNTTTPSWIGRVDGATDRVLVLDSNSLDLVNLTSGVVVATKSIPALGGLKNSKQGLDHVYYYNTTTDKINVIYADSPNSLRELPIKMNSSYPLQTYLTATNLTLQASDSKVLRVTISPSDTVVTSSQDISSKTGAIGLSPTTAAVMYDSPLGSIKLYDLDQGTEQNFEGFNLKALQGQ